MDGVAPAVLPPVPTPLLPAVAAVFAALAAVVASGGWRLMAKPSQLLEPGAPERVLVSFSVCFFGGPLVGFVILILSELDKLSENAARDTADLRYEKQRAGDYKVNLSNLFQHITLCSIKEK